MPSKAPIAPAVVTEQLVALGECIRARRKALQVSSTALAEAAGMSRVTVHRIERGEASVTIGAYLNVLAALGMTLTAQAPEDLAAARDEALAEALPLRIRLAEYPQLKLLAWQVQGTDELRPREAYGIYRRNWRHVDTSALAPHEMRLIEALRTAYGDFAAADDV